MLLRDPAVLLALWQRPRLMLLISVFFFKEKLVRNDHLGLGLIVLAAVCVMWA